MAHKVTPDDIRIINELYYKYHTYAEVARQTGLSAGTVKKYVKPDYKPFDSSNEVKFTLDMLPEIDISRFRGVDNYGALCTMSDDEFHEIQELWKEIH